MKKIFCWYDCIVQEVIEINLFQILNLSLNVTILYYASRLTFIQIYLILHVEN